MAIWPQDTAHFRIVLSVPGLLPQHFSAMTEQWRLVQTSRRRTSRHPRPPQMNNRAPVHVHRTIQNRYINFQVCAPKNQRNSLSMPPAAPRRALNSKAQGTRAVTCIATYQSHHNNRNPSPRFPTTWISTCIVSVRTQTHVVSFQLRLPYLTLNGTGSNRP